MFQELARVRPGEDGDKPAALRDGAPFKDRVLPAAMDRVRRKLGRAEDGNRQMVGVLSAVLTDGLVAVEAACADPPGQRGSKWGADGGADFDAD